MSASLKVAAAFALAAFAVAGLCPAREEKPVKYPVVEKTTEKNYDETIPGSKVKFKMMAIPGGTYLMGSPKGEDKRKDDEGPQHPVTIKPMWVGATEVTWDEFDLFWRGKPGKKEDKEPEKPKDADAVTRPTPEIWLSRCARIVSAISLIARSEIVSDRNANVSTGASAGFTLA